MRLPQISRLIRLQPIRDCFLALTDVASRHGEAVQAAANHDGNVSPVHCAEPLPVVRALSLHVL
jgi:hypothetical protein